MLSESTDRRSSHWIVVVVLAGMLLRIVLAVFPVGADSISSESLQRLTLIQTFVEDGWQGFLYPRFNIDGPRPVYIPQEFPVYIALAASVCWLTGWSVLTSGKVVSLVVALLILVASVRLFELWLPPKYRLWALLVMAFSPTVALLGRNITHDHLTLLFAVVSCLITERLNRSQGARKFWFWWILAGPVYSLMLVSKITIAIGVYLACVLYLLFTNRRFSNLLILSCPFVVALAGYGMWQWHCFTAASPLAPFSMSESWKVFLSFAPVWEALRKGVYLRWAVTLMTPFGIIFAGVGLVLLIKWRARFLFLLAWVIGTGVSFIVLFRAYLHWYYWLILSPGIAALIAIGLQSTIEFLLARSKTWVRQWSLIAISVVTLISVVLLCVYLELPRWQHWRQGSEVLKAMTPPDALVIYTGPYVYDVSVGVTFFSERKGWIVSENMENKAEYINERVREGARWLMGFDLNNEEVMPYLGLETNRDWVLRAMGTVKARQPGDGIALEERPYAIYEYVGVSTRD